MNFNYKTISHSLLRSLPERTKNILERRYGLKTGQHETLESIGKGYGITRERVRQIEEDGLRRLKEYINSGRVGPLYTRTCRYFQGQLKKVGDLKREDLLLEWLGGQKFQPQVRFFLTLGDSFERFPETEDLYSLWTINTQSVGLARNVINSFIKKFQETTQFLSQRELFGAYKKELAVQIGTDVFPKALSSYIEISKEISQGPDGRLGLRDWPEINPRGVKDRAYLVFKRERKPLHFSKVSQSIGRGVLTQTVHNELIKDPRFVLVGRGLYALSEWGYTPGVVKDVIKKVLKESKKSLTKEEICQKVLAQRFVKKNTILLNLQDKSLFLEDPQGRYKIREA